MTAISRNKVSIYITDAGVNPSAVADTDIIKGDIKSYSKSGGENDVESDPVFGGYVDKEKPMTQIEISLDVIPKLDSDQSRWDALTYATDTTRTDVYTMASQTSTQPGDKAIFISATDGTNSKSWAFNNASVTVFDLDHNADDNQSGKITFKFSPTDDNGVSNFMTAATSLADLPAWTALDNN